LGNAPPLQKLYRNVSIHIRIANKQLATEVKGLLNEQNEEDIFAIIAETLLSALPAGARLSKYTGACVYVCVCEGVYSAFSLHIHCQI